MKADKKLLIPINNISGNTSLYLEIHHYVLYIINIK